jgi:hypothetical protein
MKLDNYQTLALRTAPAKEGFLLSWKQIQLAHAILGIDSEIGEVLKAEDDLENLGEELGDVMWYLSLGCDAMNFHLSDISDKKGFSDDPFRDLQVSASALTDYFKRHLFYKTEIDSSKMVQLFEDIYLCLDDISTRFTDKPLKEWLSPNIAKLKARYPEKFSEEAAVNRDTKTEMQAFRDAE